MSKIWLVSEGAYSDYGVIGVFSTKEKADAYCAWRNGPEGNTRYDSAGVEERELDEMPSATGCYVCYRTSSTPTGVLYHEAPEWDPDLPADTRSEVSWETDHLTVERYAWITGYGPTSEHARRAADDLLRAVRAGAIVDPGHEEVK